MCKYYLEIFFAKQQPIGLTSAEPSDNLVFL